MKQTARIISTYTGDTSGVCSALFELGGLIVMHDPSGCNSTYSTHDEPRWYDMDSLVFISGLTEKDAIFGNDEKIISDTVRAAEELNPRFIAVAGTPIPYMTGCDFNAIAFEIENRCGIPTFGFETDGMKSYVRGASLAFAEYTRRMCKNTEKTKDFSVNILGATPLDFSINGSVNSIKSTIEKNGIRVNSVMAMGSTVEEIENAASAHVNLVISSCGLDSAKVMYSKFGIPYVIGTPYGIDFTQKILDSISQSALSGNNISCFDSKSTEETIIIGESVTSLSLANALKSNLGLCAKVISAVDSPKELLSDVCVKATYEDEIIPLIKNAKNIIADPMYKPICPDNINFIELPHEAFSGRIYRKKIPNLVLSLDYITNSLK